MNDSNTSNHSNSQKLDLLTLARGIYELLSINKEIESEDELFSDEVYIEIISKIIPDIQEEISPGNTPDEKVETIQMLLSILSNLVEANLSKINAKKIVIDHDKNSAKNFLELLLELINAIINNEGEELEEDDENFMDRHNISDGNMNKKKIKSNSFDEDKNFNKEEEINIDDLESLKLSKDKKKDKNKKNEKEKIQNEESEEMKIEGNYILDKEKSQSEENLLFDKENIEENKSNSKVMNVSHITDNIKDEKKELEIEDNNNISNNIEIEKDNNENDNELNSNKKLYDIPALLDNPNEKEKSKKSIENEFNNQYIDNDDEEISKKNNKYNFQPSEDDLSSNNLKESAYSVPAPYNKPLLTNNSSEIYNDSMLKKEKEIEKNKIKNKKEEKGEKDEDDFDLNYNDELDEKDLNLNLDKNSNTSLLNSNISLHSKKSKKSNKINDSKIQNSSNKKGSSKKKDNIIGGNKISNNISNKKNNHTNKSKHDFENENEITESQSNDISKSSVYTIHQKSNASSKKNSKISKKNEKNKNSNLNLNKTNNSKKSIKEKSKSSCSTIINSEIPLDDKGLKYELIKELKKIYGNQIGKALQSPNNSYILDLILQDLKMAKKLEKQKKLQNQQNSENKDNKDKDKDEKTSIDKNNELNLDDILLNKEFLIKNEKLLQLKLQMYNQKLKKRQLEQEKYVKDIGQNVQFMKKMRELEIKRIENEIIRKKNMNINNAPEEIFFCQKVFENGYQLELDKCSKEIESIKMLNDMKLEEKTKSIYDIDRYYSDKIAILNEIGRRERRENRKNKMEDELIYYQLNSIPKKDLKKKMKQILNSLDDDYYNNQEVDNNNQEEIEKILDNYYKK